MSLLQKSKSKKQFKDKTSIGNSSSRALLQLSSITSVSNHYNHDKILMSDRTIKQNKTFCKTDKNSYQDIQNINNLSLQQRKKTAKRHQASQSLQASNRVLKQLIKFNNNEQNAKKQYFQSQYESMTMLNKSHLMNSNKFNPKKHNNQKSNKKKLLLNCDQGKNSTSFNPYKTKAQDNFINRKNSNNFSLQKEGQQQLNPIICSIQINCLQNQSEFIINKSVQNLDHILQNKIKTPNRKKQFKKNSSDSVSIQKQKQFASKSINSRRSSISLYHENHQNNDQTFKKELFNIQQEKTSKSKNNIDKACKDSLNFKKDSKNKQNQCNCTQKQVYGRTRQSQRLQIQWETKQNQPELTTRQQHLSSHQFNQRQDEEQQNHINLLKERAETIIKLEQLSVVQQRLSQQSKGMYKFWNILLDIQPILANSYIKINQLKEKHTSINKKLSYLNEDLFEQNKNYVECKKLKNLSSKQQKQSILLQIDRIHNQVKKKVFKKDLEDIMIFNMKVVLPSNELNSTLGSAISFSTTNLNSSNFNQTNCKQKILCNDSFLSPGVIRLYEQLFIQKASKKYGMILKKQINNMNMYDSKTMNDYLKRLIQLQGQYNRLAKFNFNNMTKNQEIYLQSVEKLVQKIQTLKSQQEELQRQIEELQKFINQNEKQKQFSYNFIENCIIQITQNIQKEYYQFTNIMKLDGENLSNTQKCNMKQPAASSQKKQRCESCKKQFVSFKKLTLQKYNKLFEEYQKVKKQKIILQKRLKIQN